MKKRRLSFGKYKGKTVDHVIKNDMGYINWLINNAIQGFSLTPPERIKVVANNSYSVYNNKHKDIDLGFDEWGGMSDEEFTGRPGGD